MVPYRNELDRYETPDLGSVEIARSLGNQFTGQFDRLRSLHELRRDNVKRATPTFATSGRLQIGKDGASNAVGHLNQGLREHIGPARCLCMD